jgi:hypothetical protein
MRTAFQAFLVVAVIVASVIAAVQWDRKTAAESQVRADAVTTDGLNKQIGQLTKSLADDEQTIASYNASAKQDADVVTLIASEEDSVVAAAVSTPANQSALLGLANLIHPGLGTVLGQMSGAAPTPAPPTVQRNFTRWLVAGKVTPYIAASPSTQAAYAWVDVKSGATQTFQPQAAQILLAQFQQQGAH